MGRCFACAAAVVDKMLHFMKHGDKADELWVAPEWLPRSFTRNM